MKELARDFAMDVTSDDLDLLEACQKLWNLNGYPHPGGMHPYDTIVGRLVLLRTKLATLLGEPSGIRCHCGADLPVGWMGGFCPRGHSHAIRRTPLEKQPDPPPN